MIKIYDLLYQFGLTVNYTGFFYPAYAIKLCVECPVQLLLVRRWVYPATANRYKISNEAVERNIWAIGCIVWSSLLEHMEDTRLTHEAGNTRLLIILTYSLPSHRLLTACGLCRMVICPGKNIDMRVINGPTIQGDDWPFISENSVSLSETQVGGNNGTFPSIAV